MYILLKISLIGNCKEEVAFPKPSGTSLREESPFCPSEPVSRGIAVAWIANFRPFLHSKEKGSNYGGYS